MSKSVNKQLIFWIVLKSLFQIGLLSLILLLNGCINDDELDFPVEPDTTQFSESTAIISLLRAVEKSNLTTNQSCFELFYPVEFRYNNDLTITVESFQGLSEVANNMNAGLHVNAVAFPILASKGDVIKTINNESDLLELLEECELVTLRDEFDKYFTQCFDFVYPIEMIALDSGTVPIDTLQDYFDFEAQQGFDKQPIFVYPLEVYSYSKNQIFPVTNDFELFEIFDMCKTCPSLFFTTDWAGDTRYVFEADFPEIDQLEQFAWYVDGIKIEEDGIGVNGDFILDRTFEPGTYEICMKAQSLAFDCFAGTQYCEILEVVDPCPSLSFIVEEITADTYEFTATFEKQDEIEYSWAIYQNQDLIFFEEEKAGGDDRLEYQFNPGDYVVCVEAEVHGCSTVTKVCEEIIVN
ncbi:hypothetical protein AAOE16_15515 [Ekhidna sp. MALMAid0563]|uniref:hypothetical protein n=1 Tax=Ekhidna sp. MALMAid0563 TaxID=3143937 RepID=UPI0032DE8371